MDGFFGGHTVNEALHIFYEAIANPKLHQL